MWRSAPLNQSETALPAANDEPPDPSAPAPRSFIGHLGDPDGGVMSDSRRRRRPWAEVESSLTVDPGAMQANTREGAVLDPIARPQRAYAPR